MSRPSATFRSSEVIILLLGAGIVFTLSSPVVLLRRGSGEGALITLTIGLALNAIGLVLGRIRARRESPGDGFGPS